MRILLASIVVAATAACSLFDKTESPGGVDGGVGQACDTLADCDHGLVCAADVCTVEGSLGVGSMCSASRDCSTGLFCALNGICAPAGGGDVGAACASGSDCKKGL